MISEQKVPKVVIKNKPHYCLHMLQATETSALLNQENSQEILEMLNPGMFIPPLYDLKKGRAHQEWTVLHAKRQRHRLERTAARRRSGRGGRARAGESWAAEKDRRGARRARKLKKRARTYGGHGGKGGGRKHGEGRFSKHRLDRRAGAHLARDSQRRYVDRAHMAAIFGANNPYGYSYPGYAKL